MANVSPFRPVLELKAQVLGIEALLLPRGHNKSQKWEQNVKKNAHFHELSCISVW